MSNAFAGVTGRESHPFAAPADPQIQLSQVNTSRHEAYRRMIARGFRTEITGVAMQRPNEPGYNRADVFALDDWR